MKKLSKMSFTRGSTRDFNKYDKSHDYFYYSSTDDYREDLKDDEVKASVRTSVRNREYSSHVINCDSVIIMVKT